MTRKAILCMRCTEKECKGLLAFEPSHGESFAEHRRKCIRGQLDWTQYEKDQALRELDAREGEWLKNAAWIRRVLELMKNEHGAVKKRGRPPGRTPWLEDAELSQG